MIDDFTGIEAIGIGIGGKRPNLFHFCGVFKFAAPSKPLREIDGEADDEKCRLVGVHGAMRMIPQHRPDGQLYRERWRKRERERNTGSLSCLSNKQSFSQGEWRWGEGMMRVPGKPEELQKVIVELQTCSVHAPEDGKDVVDVAQILREVDTLHETLLVSRGVQVTIIVHVKFEAVWQCQLERPVPCPPHARPCLILSV